MRVAMLALFAVTLGFSAHASECSTPQNSKLIQDLRESFHRNDDVTLTADMPLHMDSRRHLGSDEVGTAKKGSIVRVFRLPDMSLSDAIDGVYVEVIGLRGDQLKAGENLPDAGFLAFEDLNCPIQN